MFNPGSYPHTAQLLQRLEKEKLVKRYKRIGTNLAELWALPKTRFAIGTQFIEHDLAVADLFVTYYLTGDLDHWDVYWDEAEKGDADNHLVFYDARMSLQGHTFFWEVDRGTEPVYDPQERSRITPKRWAKSINGKIEKYIELAKQNPKDKFSVLFTIADHRYGVYDHDRTMDRAKQILDLLADYRRGNQFLVAVHHDIIGDRFGTPGEIHNELLGDPYGAHFVSPLDPATPVSLKDLIQTKSAASAS